MGHGDGPMGHGVGGDKQPQNNHMRWSTQDGDWIFPGKQYFFCIFIHYWRKKWQHHKKPVYPLIYPIN